MRIMGYKSRFFAMVAAALLVVSLPSAGYAAGQAEEELVASDPGICAGCGRRWHPRRCARVVG